MSIVLEGCRPLADGARQLARPANRVYMARFMRDLRAKVRAMAVRWPRRVSTGSSA